MKEKAILKMMKIKNSKTKTIIRTTLIIYLGLCIHFLPCSYGRSVSEQIITGVSVGSKVFNPLKGEKAEIKYKLSKRLQIKAGIYDPSGRLVRIIPAGDVQDSGYHTLVWDGKDEAGSVVPDEAYTYAIFGWDNNVKAARYYPVKDAGETLTLMDSRLNRETGEIEYVLPKAARVRIRIGTEDGPLLRTLLDWSPRKAGKNVEQWDGKDSEGLRDLLGDKRLIIVVSLFSLPMNSIITEGNGSPVGAGDDGKGQDKNNVIPVETGIQGLAERHGSPIGAGDDSRDKKNVIPVKTGIHNSIKVSEEILKQSNPDMLIDHDRFVIGGYSSHGLHKRDECLEPEFSVSFPGKKTAGTSAPLLNGIVPVRIDLGGRDRGRLTGNRFEIKFYVDDLFIFEEEQGLNPYTYKWNTRGMSEGDHILTVNVIEAGGMDHIGTKSLRVKIGR